jgi:metal-responsive CopG/Arc/MetJ family transcriptional regulator
METVQIVLEKELLRATDRAAKKLKRNRSALVRDALRAHLRWLEIRAQEEQERAAYKAHPQDPDEVRMWETVTVWPED